jgi:hypothetical protein
MGEAADHVRDMLQRLLPETADVKALAAAFGLHDTTIYNWRAGTRGLGPDDLVAIARYFHMSVDQLLGMAPVEPIGWTVVDRKIEAAAVAAATLVQELQAVRSALAGEAPRAARRSPKRGSRQR